MPEPKDLLRLWDASDPVPIQVDREGRIILVADRAQLIVLLQMLTDLQPDQWRPLPDPPKAEP